MRIADAYVGTAIDRTDIEVLVAALLGRDRSWLLAHGEEALTPEQELTLRSWIARRETGEPVAYITGRKEFYGRTFLVTTDVLIPRPATERLVDETLLLLEKTQGPPAPVPGCGVVKTHMTHVDQDIVAFCSVWGDLHNVRAIVDIGTGSGCIAVTLACEFPSYRIIAVDVSTAALDVARKNAECHRVADRVTFLQGNLLEPLVDECKPFLLVSNPPYIPGGAMVQQDVADFEPHCALFAGSDGMDVLRPLVVAARMHTWCRGVLVECRKEQAEKLLLTPSFPPIGVSGAVS